MNDDLRKCKYCDKDKSTKSINIYNNDYVIHNGQYAHIECVKTYEQNKKRGKKVGKELDIFINKLIEETKLYRKEIIDREKLYNWLYDHYNITVLNRFLCTKIAEINNGNYSGLKEGISNEDLLNIFMKMQNYLDKLAYKKNKSKNPFKDQLNRINYDLAIVVNNYDKYKEWKVNQEKLQIEEQEQLNKIEDKKIYNTLLNKQQQKYVKKEKNNKDGNKINVINIIDELF